MNNSEKCFFQSCFEILELVKRKGVGEMHTSCSFSRNSVKKCKNDIFVNSEKSLAWASIWEEQFREMLFSVLFRDIELVRMKQEVAKCWTSCSFSRNRSKSAKDKIFVTLRKTLDLSCNLGWAIPEKFFFSVILQYFELLSTKRDSVKRWHLAVFYETCQKVQNWGLWKFQRNNCLSTNLERETQRNTFFNLVSRILNFQEECESSEMLTSCWFSRNTSKSSKMRSLQISKKPCLWESIWNEKFRGMLFSVTFWVLEHVKKKRCGPNADILLIVTKYVKKCKNEIFVIFQKSLAWASIWDEKFR